MTIKVNCLRLVEGLRMPMSTQEGDFNFLVSVHVLFLHEERLQMVFLKTVLIDTIIDHFQRMY